MRSSDDSFEAAAAKATASQGFHRPLCVLRDANQYAHGEERATAEDETAQLLEMASLLLSFQSMEAPAFVDTAPHPQAIARPAEGESAPRTRACAIPVQAQCGPLRPVHRPLLPNALKLLSGSTPLSFRIVHSRQRPHVESRDSAPGSGLSGHHTPSLSGPAPAPTLCSSDRRGPRPNVSAVSSKLTQTPAPTLPTVLLPALQLHPSRRPRLHTALDSDDALLGEMPAYASGKLQAHTSRPDVPTGINANDASTSLVLIRPVPECRFEDCPKNAVGRGQCHVHLERRRCSVDGGTRGSWWSCPCRALSVASASIPSPQSVAVSSSNFTEALATARRGNVTEAMHFKLLSKRARLQCRHNSCNNKAVSRNFCVAHGGGTRCTDDGCQRGAKKGGKCIRHGGGVRCSMDHCRLSAQSSGKCKTHTVINPTSSAPEL